MEIINSNKRKLNGNKIYIIIGFAVLALFSLVAGFTFAFFSDSKEITGITFSFGQIKVIYLDSDGNVVDRNELSINTKMNQTAKTYKVGDVVNLSGYLGLDADSFSSYLRLQVFADFKNADGTDYSPESVYTTFKFQEGFNNALASTSQTLMQNGSNDKAWYSVENNNYIYLGNVATSRQLSTESATKYDNSNLYNYNGTSITITDNMIANEINGKTVDLTFVCQALVQKLNPLENIDNGYTQTNADNIANLNWASYFTDDYGLVQSTQVLAPVTNSSTKTATLTKKFDNITGYIDTPEYVVKPNTNGTATIGSITYTDLNPNAVYVATRQRLTPAFTTAESNVYKVTAFASNAFNGCKLITGIYLPKTLTSIIGSSVFKNCNALNKVDCYSFDTWMNINFSSTPLDVTKNLYFEDGSNAYNETALDLSNYSKINSYALYNWSSLKSVILSDNLTSIGSYAFEGCSSLTSITIPDKVTSIGSYAFEGCSSLMSITIPEGVRSIGEDAFYNCSSLTSITIPDKVTSIPESAFVRCSNLTSITIPSNVTSIGRSAFSGCGGLTSITIPDKVTSIPERAFYGCSSLTSITIPDNVTSIGNYAFRYCSSLTSITIPSNVTSIGRFAFYNCSSLTSITIPDKVTSIPESAFCGCSSLTSITIPDKVTSIGRSAFQSCSSLMSVTFSDNSQLPSIGEYAFCNCSSLTSITIPDKVTSIGYCAFYDCSSLMSITIPSNVTSIGSSAFYNCYKLRIVYNLSSLNIVAGSGDNGCVAYYAYKVYTESTTGDVYSAINGVIYVTNTDGENTLTAIGITGEVTSISLDSNCTQIAGFAFYGCSNLTSITIPDKVTSIGKDAFEGCSSLTSITIPDKVTSIGEYAFYNCSSLTSITIPDNVTSIGKYAFYGCSNLTSITIPDKVTSIGYYAFYGCSSLMSITIPSNVTSIGSSAFSGCGGLTSITIPDKVTSIPERAFEGCSNLTSITIPSNVTSIGSSAFSGCSSLTSITIPDKVTSIGSSAFYDCSSLMSITIPDKVTSIGSSAFNNCSSLTSVTIPDNVTSIGNYAFYGCSNMKELHIGNVASWLGITFGNSWFGLVYVKTKWYVNNEELREITADDFGDTITSIHDYAFYNCSSLTSVTIPDNVTSIGTDAFLGCYNIKEVIVSDLGAWSMINFGSAVANPLSQTFNSYITYGAKLYEQKTNEDGTITKELVTRITEQDLTTNTAKKIGNYAFYGYSYLTSVVLSSGFSVGTDAFRYCYALGEVYNFTGTGVTAGSSSSTLGYVAQYAKVIKTAYESMDGEIGIIESSVVVGSEDSNVLYYVKKDASGVVTKKVLLKVLNNGNSGVIVDVDCTEISGYAFYDCDKLVDVYFSGTEEMYGKITITTSNNCNKPVQLAKKHFINFEG